MTDKPKPYIPGSIVIERLEKNLTRQRDINTYLKYYLKEMPHILTQVGAVALRDLKNELLEMRTVVDKSIRLAEESESTVNAAAGHAAEASALVKKSDDLEYSLADAVTIIKNQAEWFRGDVDTIRTVLEIVDPAVFFAAFASLPVERQAALAFKGDTE